MVDGPFTESKEIIAGYWLWEVSSLEEAVEWAKRCPSDPQFGARQVLEVRPIFTAEDFGAEYTEDLQAQDARLAEEIKARHGASKPLGQLRSAVPCATSVARSKPSGGWRAPRLIATLARLVRDVGLAEELAQDAFVLALEQWPEHGVPDNPAAWLTATAKHKAIDAIRRERGLGTPSTPSWRPNPTRPLRRPRTRRRWWTRRSATTCSP